MPRLAQHLILKGKTTMSDTPKPDLLDNMIQRTDNDFNGIKDESLIGHDLPDDEDETEDGEDEIDRKPARDPKTL